MAQAAAMFQQLSDELATARTQITRISTEMEQIKAQAAAAIAASEARTQALINQTRGNGGGEEKFDIVDFKVAKPDPYYGRRDESWKA